MVEYWPLGGEYSVISIVEADSAQVITASLITLSDVMEFSITPAVTSEEGLRFAQKMMAKPRAERGGSKYARDS